VLVNNAAIQIEEELVKTTEEQLDPHPRREPQRRLLRLQARREGDAPYRRLHNHQRRLHARTRGRGILAAYCATKGGVLDITRATAVQYGVDGIRCNALCPGDIDTPLVQGYFNTSEDPKALRAEISAEYPLGRNAQPQEIVVFLSSDDSAFMTGQPLAVDGGLLATCY
jgi:NAD(P)-dependent dehydrogenase (short-subunit alcohol dehydrogenase family)